MRIAIFATSELQTFPEYQDMARRHRVTPFLAESGDTLRDWHNELRHSTFDVLHFAGHIVNDDRDWPTRLVIGNVTMEMEDVVNLSRLSSAKMLFFNSCDSAMIANYAIHNGTPAAVYTTAPLADRDAWKFPLMMYETLARQEDEDVLIDYRRAFEQAVERNGFYGWASNGLYERELLSPLVAEIGKVYDTMAEHTNNVNASIMAYDARIAQVSRHLLILAVAGGSAVFFNAILMAMHYLGA